MAHCKFCGSTQTDEYPPTTIVYDVRSETLHYTVCAQCLHNIDLAMAALTDVFKGRVKMPWQGVREVLQKLDNGYMLVEDDIPF